MSKFFNLDWQDLMGAFIMTVIATFLASLVNVAQNGHIPSLPELRQCFFIGIIGGVAYLNKNLIRNSDGQYLKGEAPKDPSGK